MTTESIEIEPSSRFSLKQAWSVTMCFALALVVMAMPDFAHASAAVNSATGGGAIGNVLCNVVDWFNGPIGRGLATLAIIVIGVGALMGKVSWGMAIIVGVGVAVVFGADTIVSELGAGDGEGQEGCDADNNSLV